MQFTRPIAGYQLVQEKLVDMLEEITKAQLLAWRLGRLKEAGKARPQQVSLAKRNNVRIALAASRATPATSSAPTASPTSTRRAATCATSSRSSPTRAPTTSTR